MKHFIFLAGILALTSQVHAGNEGGGGGDLCENQIQLIRDDLKSWIVKGGHKSLKLTEGVSKERYSTKMLEAFSLTKIRCVSPGDAGYPVQVLGTPKECRFDRGNTNVITCDRNKFLSKSEASQFLLVHHEFAGVANLEKPNGDVSNYEISNQLSKLEVKPHSSSSKVKVFFATEHDVGANAALAQAKVMALRSCVWATGTSQLCTKSYQSVPVATGTVAPGGRSWYWARAGYTGKVPSMKDFKIHYGNGSGDRFSSLQYADDQALQKCIAHTGNPEKCEKVWESIPKRETYSSDIFYAQVFYRSPIN